MRYKIEIFVPAGTTHPLQSAAWADLPLIYDTKKEATAALRYIPGIARVVERCF